MQHRFLKESHLLKVSSAGKLRVVQSLRLLTRDATFRKRFVKMGGVKVLASITDALAQEHFESYSQARFSSSRHGETPRPTLPFASRLWFLSAFDRMAAQPPPCVHAHHHRASQRAPLRVSAITSIVKKSAVKPLMRRPRLRVLHPPGAVPSRNSDGMCIDHQEACGGRAVLPGASRYR